MDDATFFQGRSMLTYYEGCWRHEGHHACAATKVEQLQAEVKRLRMLLSQDGAAYLPCQRCHKNVAVPTLESVELCFDCWEQMNTKVEQLRREKDDITATLTAEYDQLEKAFDAGWGPERLRAQKAEAWTEQLQRLLHDERVRRYEWEKLNSRLIAGTEVERLQGRLGQVKTALNNEVDSRVCAELEVEQLRAELVQARKQLAAPTQKCAYCGYQYSAGTDASNFSVIAEHIKSCSKHPLAKALAKLAQAEALAALVTPELAQLLERLKTYANTVAADYEGLPEYHQSLIDDAWEARNIAAKIREVLSEH